MDIPKGDPRNGAQSPRCAARSPTLERLRADVVPAATRGTPMQVYIGGNTAGFEDFSDTSRRACRCSSRSSSGLSVLLLIAAFRSLWIPLVSGLGLGLAILIDVLVVPLVIAPAA